jgi:hypothetical protein
VKCEREGGILESRSEGEREEESSGIRKGVRSKVELELKGLKEMKWCGQRASSIIKVVGVER